jgi:hypothetical protein
MYLDQSPLAATNVLLVYQTLRVNGDGRSQPKLKGLVSSTRPSLKACRLLAA